jgi:hypothetical protein
MKHEPGRSGHRRKVKLKWRLILLVWGQMSTNGFQACHRESCLTKATNGTAVTSNKCPEQGTTPSKRFVRSARSVYTSPSLFRNQGLSSIASRVTQLRNWQMLLTFQDCLFVDERIAYDRPGCSVDLLLRQRHCLVTLYTLEDHCIDEFGRAVRF